MSIHLARHLRRLRQGAALTVVTALVTSVAAAPSVRAAAPGKPSALAAPAAASDNARAKAHRLRQQLAQLQDQAEQATEDYNTAQAQLGNIVAAHLLAQRQLEDAQNAVAGQNFEQTATVRSLYRTGGTSALYATILGGSDPSDVLSRLRAVQHLVDAQQSVTQNAKGVVTDATAIEAHLATLARQRTDLTTRATTAMARVQSLVSRQVQVVAAADAEVIRLEQAEAAQVAAAAAAHASQSLDQARAAAVPGGPGDVGAPNTGVVDIAINAARAQVGKPYAWGATGPSSFDCSGLTGWAYAAAGVLLPRTSRQQWFAGPHPGLGYLQPGDLLFWATNTADPSTIHHVALYIGNDQMIAAPHTGADVTVQPVYLDGYIGAVRPTASG